MRRISANYIFPVSQSPLKNGIIELDDQGRITDIIDTHGELKESRGLEFYNGILTPGFINAHCHLELSCLRNTIQKKIGLPGFLEEIVRHKKTMDPVNVNHAMHIFDQTMRKEGIVAVGDISNTKNSIRVKTQSKIYYHTFIEVLGLGENYNEVFIRSLELLNAFGENNLKASLVPHAPYSVSEKLMEKIKGYAEKNSSILSIHNQESAGENEMFKYKKGQLVNALQKIGVDLTHWIPTGENSVTSIIQSLPKNNNFILVHNTFSTHSDIELVNRNLNNPYWCLCPLSNLFIENRLPDFNLFKLMEDQVVLGTDSLASNEVLSVLAEMKTIVKHQADISFHTLLKWATLNGSKALKIDNRYGSLEVGKSPGINLITHFDFSKNQITEKSRVKVLV